MVQTLQTIMFSYDVTGSFDTQNKNDDGDDDDVMMLSTRIQLTLRNVERWACREDGFTMFAKICLSTLIGFGPG